MGAIEWLRNRTAPIWHSGTATKSKLKNKNFKKAQHLGFKVSQSKAGQKFFGVLRSVQNLGRKLRSMPIKIRLITPVEAEVLSAVKTGRAVDASKLKKTDLKSTAQELSKLQQNMDATVLQLDKAKTATLAESDRIGNITEAKVELYKQAVVKTNHNTLREDLEFVDSNPKMVRDYSLHLLLYKGVKNKEGKNASLSKYYKSARRAEQQQVTNKRAELFALKAKKENELTAAGESRANNPELEAIKSQISATTVNETLILQQVLTSFQDDVIGHLSSKEDILAERYAKADDGNVLLAPKPLVAWDVAVVQDLYNMILELQTDESKLNVFMEQHREDLGLPSSRYLGLSSLSAEMEQHIQEMENKETETIEEPIILEKPDTPITDRKVYTADDPKITRNMPRRRKHKDD